jgi:hypothetical protein
VSSSVTTAGAGRRKSRQCLSGHRLMARIKGGGCGGFRIDELGVSTKVILVMDSSIWVIWEVAVLAEWSDCTPCCSVASDEKVSTIMRYSMNNYLIQPARKHHVSRAYQWAYTCTCTHDNTCFSLFVNSPLTASSYDNEIIYRQYHMFFSMRGWKEVDLSTRITIKCNIFMKILSI